MILLVVLIAAAAPLTPGWFMVGARSGQSVIDPIPFASRLDCEAFGKMIPSGNQAGRCVLLPRRANGTPDRDVQP